MDKCPNHDLMWEKMTKDIKDLSDSFKKLDNKLEGLLYFTTEDENKVPQRVSVSEAVKAIYENRVTDAKFLSFVKNNIKKIRVLIKEDEESETDISVERKNKKLNLLLIIVTIISLSIAIFSQVVK